MSKSVDETVFDYFSILLTEPAPEVKSEAQSAIKPEQEAQAVVEARTEQTPPATSRLRDDIAVPVDTAPKKAPLSRPDGTAKQYPAEPDKPRLDRNALEQLLAPVFKEQVAEVTHTEMPTETLSETISAASLQSEAITGQVDTQTDATQREQTQVQEVTEPEVLEQVKLETQVGAPAAPIEPLKEQLEDEFQVLFFKVAGLTLAVPLISLGGIVRIERINHIFGRPGWFMGVQGYRDSQLNIVDTCAWVMPEKYDDKLAQSVNYQYLVVLENSNWGLACESLVNAVKIDKSQVNWRGSEGKRPWLAGVVKEQMCGILHVQALIEMLNAGLGCQDPID
ncbi:chemotaxis protein CheW [Shewanella algae]|uniref:chemotaxis protein CheW n=1 Tax=Shewanella algae TaxID=38313 RepID=UPI001AAD8820|nr:chemotaxis protein CheW [Shewanella algae]MBO2551806.1 chemotaxis protein CheW [Shewanella algae]